MNKNQKLIIFFGNVGVGKTEISKKVAETRGYAIVSFESTVRSIKGHGPVFNNEDHYVLTKQETQKVHDTMHKTAKDHLESGKSVILESVYPKKYRDQAIAIAKSLKTPYQLIHIICDEAITKHRLKERKKKDPWNAGIIAYERLKNISKPGKENYRILNTSQKSVEACANEIIKKADLL